MQRGVKQGGTLSAILFNCILDIAFDEWYASLRDEKIFIVHGLARFTNTRYADDVFLYAKSFEEFVSMKESLMIALQRIGLILNTQKTKILLCNPSMDESTLNFVEIGDGFVKVFNDNEFH